MISYLKSMDKYLNGKLTVVLGGGSKVDFPIFNNIVNVNMSSNNVDNCIYSNIENNDIDNTDNTDDSVENYKTAFVLLGVYPENHVLQDVESSMFTSVLENGGNIYMEGADLLRIANESSNVGTSNAAKKYLDSGCGYYISYIEHF